MPDNTPGCACMIEIRANGQPVQGPATVALILCPLHEAAPQLYAALEAFTDGTTRDWTNRMANARKALAKARGEE
jgi:hypothetical protein